MQRRSLLYSVVAPATRATTLLLLFVVTGFLQERRYYRSRRLCTTGIAFSPHCYYPFKYFTLSLRWELLTATLFMLALLHHHRAAEHAQRFMYILVDGTCCWFICGGTEQTGHLPAGVRCRGCGSFKPVLFG